MSERDFLDHWLRIGTTHKIDQKVSPLGRPLTGSKGIGRLSVQFLAEGMTIETTAAGTSGCIYAIVDWTSVIRGADLETVDVLWQARDETPSYPDGSSTGTRITLTGLKHSWDKSSLEDLGREVWRLRSPFRKGSKVRGERRPEEFEIDIEAPAIEGAKDAFDKVRRTLFQNFKARIIGSLDRGRTGGQANIAVEFVSGYPEGAKAAKTYKEVVSIPVRGDDSPLLDKARFEILVFKTEGRQPGGVPVKEIRDYLQDFGNVSVYDSGFRLPYYGASKDATGHDWLDIALDQGRRISVSELLPESLRTQNKYMEDLPAPGRIFGAVDIDTNHERSVLGNAAASPGDWLQMQPGRDRLHDNKAFKQLRDFVRFALDFYANRHRLRALQADERLRTGESPSKKYDRAIRVLEENKSEIPAPVFRQVKREIAEAQKASVAEERTQDLRAALLAPLATAGMVALALNHELAREIRFLESMSGRIRAIAAKHSIAALDVVVQEFEEARSRLMSLREIFSPLVSNEDIEANDRLKVREVVKQTASAMRVLTPRVSYDISEVPADLRFPLGSLAEWNAVLQNIIANSWNAMLDSVVSVIKFDGGRDKRGNEWLRVSDTGSGLDVPISESDALFEPFVRKLAVSSEKRSVAIGGQGLGLAIVRMIMKKRHGSVAFVEPSKGFATSIQLSWTGAKQ